MRPQPFSFRGVEYPSQLAAARASGMSKSTFYRRVVLDMKLVRPSLQHLAPEEREARARVLSRQRASRYRNRHRVRVRERNNAWARKVKAEAAAFFLGGGL